MHRKKLIYGNSSAGRWNAFTYFEFISPLSVTCSFLLGNYAFLYSQPLWFRRPFISLPVWMVSTPGPTHRSTAHSLVSVTDSEVDTWLNHWHWDLIPRLLETVKLESLLLLGLLRELSVFLLSRSKSLLDNGTETAKNRIMREQTQELIALSKLLHTVRP